MKQVGGGGGRGGAERPVLSDNEPKKTFVLIARKRIGWPEPTIVV
jgi:hypothetical protein